MTFSPSSAKAPMANTWRGRFPRTPDDARQTHQETTPTSPSRGSPLKPSRLVTFGGGDLTTLRPAGGPPHRLNEPQRVAGSSKRTKQRIAKRGSGTHESTSGSSVAAIGRIELPRGGGHGSAPVAQASPLRINTCMSDHMGSPWVITATVCIYPDGSYEHTVSAMGFWQSSSVCPPDPGNLASPLPRFPARCASSANNAITAHIGRTQVEWPRLIRVSGPLALLIDIGAGTPDGEWFVVQLHSKESAT